MFHLTKNTTKTSKNIYILPVEKEQKYSFLTFTSKAVLVRKQKIGQQSLILHLIADINDAY